MLLNRVKQRRVLIVDEHAVVRVGLKFMLKEMDDGIEILEVATGADALILLRESHWDLVIMGINLPDRSGFDLIKYIKNRHRKLPILVFSTHPEEQYALRSLRAGASGYLSKEALPTTVQGAISKVLDGERYISDKVVNLLTMELVNDADTLNLHDHLSDREFEVLRQISSGHSVSEIAENLSLSVKTVSTYRSRLLEKMHMKHNAELTHYAIKNGLV